MSNQSTVEFQSIKIRYIIHKIIHDNILTSIDLLLNATSKDFNNEKEKGKGSITSSKEIKEDSKQENKLIMKLKELLPYSNTGHLITHVCYSICPRLLVVGQKKTQKKQLHGL